MHTHIAIHGAREHNLKKQDTPVHFVGSLPVSDYPDLLAVPLLDYDELGDEDPGLDGCLAHRSAKKVFGREYEVVVAYNPELYEGQMQGIEHNIAQCQKGFNNIRTATDCFRQNHRFHGPQRLDQRANHELLPFAVADRRDVPLVQGPPAEFLGTRFPLDRSHDSGPHVLLYAGANLNLAAFTRIERQ